MMKRLQTLGVSALVTSVFLVASPAFAQLDGNTPGGDTQQPQQQQPTDQIQDNFSEDELKSYIESRDKMQDIRQDFTKKAQEITDQEKRSQLRQETNEKLVDAIKSTSLTVQEFTQINQAVRSNPELADKLQSLQ